MLKNVVFDIGQVLVDFGYRKMVRAKGYSGEMEDIIAEATILSPYWKEMDRGVWGREKCLEKFIELAPDLADDIHKCFDNLEGICQKRETSIPWIEDLKKRGLKVYYLSNYPREVIEEDPVPIDFVPHCDGGVFSCDVNLLKPDPEIYKTLLNKYGLKPEETVFVDDLPENVSAAVSLGINGIVFTSYEEANASILRLQENLQKQ